MLQPNKTNIFYKRKNMKKLAIIIPCFNEEAVLPQSIKTLSSLLKSLIKEKLISPDSSLVFVDDGSKDKTWEIIEKSNTKTPFIKGISLATTTSRSTPRRSL